MKYADYFNVSMDYLFLRTNVPEGINYEFTPRFDTDNKQFKQFIDMCFDPESPLNEKLKKSYITYFWTVINNERGNIRKVFK